MNQRPVHFAVRQDLLIPGQISQKSLAEEDRFAAVFDQQFDGQFDAIEVIG